MKAAVKGAVKKWDVQRAYMGVIGQFRNILAI